MSLILKIATGIVIGLFSYHVIMLQITDIEYEEINQDVIDTQKLRNKFIILTNAIHSYYRNKKELPRFISDLKCFDMLDNGRQNIACASVVSNGIFYVNHKNDWASAEPYILDRKVFNKCKTSKKFAIEFGDGGGMYNDCLSLNVNSIPKQQTPAFDCDKTSNEVEKIICSSDRLIESSVNLSLVYKNMLSISTNNEQQHIKDNQIKFNKQLRNKCKTTKCIETTIERKISRLELLGIWEK